MKMNKAGLGRILGPKGLMPSTKTNTVVKDVGASVTDMVGASEYRERLGVVRMAVGQLGMTPEELSRNIKSFIENVKKDMATLSDRISKDIHEVVSCCPTLQFFLHLVMLTLLSLTGPQLNKWPRSKSKRRLQRSRVHPIKGSLDPVTAEMSYCKTFCIYTPY